MKLLVFSDIHGDTKALRSLMEVEADYYICAGDLANWARGLTLMGEILSAKASQVWLMPGNHEHESHIKDLCDHFGFNFFHGVSFEAHGWHIAGLGYSNHTPFNTPGEYTEEEIAERLERFAELDPLILICHCPPKGTILDATAPGRHFGSTAVKDFIDRHQPAWFLCGHIHEAAGHEVQIGATRGINVGKGGWLLDL